MELRVTLLSGELLAIIKTSPLATILQLKDRLAAECVENGVAVVPTIQMELAFEGRVLEDECSISKFELPTTAVVYLIQRAAYTISPSNDSGCDFLFKVAIIGPTNAGKSCLLNRLVTGVFKTDYSLTLGVHLRVVPLLVNNRSRVKLQVWDTPGLERYYRNVTCSYLLGMQAILVVFDTTKRESFLSVAAHLEDVQRYGAEHVCVALVGTKVDSKLGRDCDGSSDPGVSEEEAECFAAKRGLAYYGVSAKDGVVDAPFHHIVGKLMNQASARRGTVMRDRPDAQPEITTQMHSHGFVV